MLESMHKHMKWLMWAIVIIITVAFLFFGIMPSGSSGRTLASVNGDVITIDDLNRVYQNMVETYRGILKNQLNDSFRKRLKSQALNELITNRLLVQEAKRVGLRVTDEELQETIIKIPAFSPQGTFDTMLYRRFLSRINFTPAEFEANQREFLLRNKMEQLIEDGVAVTDPELAALYKSRNPKMKQRDFAKNKANFKKQVLAEKRNGTVTAYVTGLQAKANIRIFQDRLPL